MSMGDPPIPIPHPLSKKKKIRNGWNHRAIIWSFYLFHLLLIHSFLIFPDECHYIVAIVNSLSHLKSCFLFNIREHYNFLCIIHFTKCNYLSFTTFTISILLFSSWLFSFCLSITVISTHVCVRARLLYIHTERMLLNAFIDAIHPNIIHTHTRMHTNTNTPTQYKVHSTFYNNVCQVRITLVAE